MLAIGWKEMVYVNRQDEPKHDSMPLYMEPAFHAVLQRLGQEIDLWAEWLHVVWTPAHDASRAHHLYGLQPWLGDAMQLHFAEFV